MARQPKSGSARKRAKEYTGGGLYGARYSQRELLREREGLADVLEPEPTRDMAGNALRWAAVGVLMWIVLLGGVAYVALR